MNDVGRVRSEKLEDRYKKLLREVKENGKRCRVSGVLPRRGERLVALTCLWHEREVEEDVWGECGRFYR